MGYTPKTSDSGDGRDKAKATVAADAIKITWRGAGK